MVSAGRIFALLVLGSAVPAYAQTVAPSVSSSPVISGNGQFVAFTSTANLDSNPGDGPTTADLFVRDLTGGVTERWTTNQAVIGLPSISADGRYVVFTTASPLVAADTNAVDDVYLLDRQAPRGSHLRLLTSPTTSPMIPSVSWWPFTSAALTGLNLVPGSVTVAVGGSSPAPDRPQTPGGLTASGGGSSPAPVRPVTNPAPNRPVTNAAAVRPVGSVAPGRTLTDADFEAIRAERIATAVRTAGRITLDGRLDEPAWKTAPPATDFLQRVPRTGEVSTERTEARFIYDDDTLYVGITAFDSEPSRQVIKELKEDFDANGSDTVQILLDGMHDRRTGFMMSVNPAGARRDSQLSQNGPNLDWDGVWDAKVSKAEDAWFVEFAIPFGTLRFTKAPSQEWGLGIMRRIPRRNEESSWSPLPVRFQFTRVDQAGTLRGLNNLSPGRNLKVKPYFLAQTTETLLDGRLTSVASLGRLKDYNAGFDVKYSLTPSLTLDTTFRTDFAQVEADQQQVNLTRFNLFFPEKRDFFLENSSIFAFGANQQGGGAAAGGGGGNQANLVPFFSRRIGLSGGMPVPVIGGGRVTGQVKGYDVGVLAMKTEEFRTTPSNGYLVGRLRRNFLGNSFIGALVTNRDSTIAGDYNRVYGTDLHLQFFQKLDFDSFILRSDTPAKSGSNQARRLQTSWRDDDLNVAVEYNKVEPNFNPEVGFVRRDNMSQYSGDLTWLPRLERSDLIRNLTFATSADYFKSGTTGDVETRVREGRAGIQFENNGSTNFTITETFDRLVEPFEIHADLWIPVGDYEYLRYRADVNSGNSRKIIANGNFTWGDFWNGDNKAVNGNLDLRLNHHWSLDLNYGRNHVTLPNGDFTTQLVGMRFLYAFTSRAFVNAFFQYNTDTSQVSSNIRFNVTHRPLSDLYIVYNDTRDTSSGQLAGRALMVKLTNLFNF